MDISLQGFGQKTATFLTSTTDLVAGEPVMMDTSYTVKRATAGQFVIGVCSHSNGSYASVILNGVVEVPYSGSSPTLGLYGLCCDGAGGVKADSDPLFYYKILNIDSTNKILTLIL